MKKYYQKNQNMKNKYRKEKREITRNSFQKNQKNGDHVYFDKY